MPGTLIGLALAGRETSGEESVDKAPFTFLGGAVFTIAARVKDRGCARGRKACPE
jgi:hypothetical protein